MAEGDRLIRSERPWRFAIDFMLGEGQAILVTGNYVPTNRKAESGTAKTRLKFVDPAAMLDESAKWEKLYAEIITRQSK